MTACHTPHINQRYFFVINVINTRFKCATA